MQPKVSILLPFFNSADTLADAIESILCQSFENFELILINNNSIDNSFAIANNFATHDSRIKIIHEERQNFINALNSGIEASNCSYIALMDGRDISFPERIEKQFNFLKSNSNIGLVSTQLRNPTEIEALEEYERLNQYINWINRIITHNDFSINRFIETPFIVSTAMFRKELIGIFGGFWSGNFPPEFELTLRWMEHGVMMYKLPEVLYDWSYSPERFSYSDDRYFDQGLFETKSYFLNNWLKENNKFYPEVVVWGAGRNSRQKFYILHELGVEAKFFIDLRANPEHKVIQYQHTPPAGSNFIISYVSNRAAREKIRMFLVELGYIEGIDFICVA
jgi:glycosyltransferase involved in cell wall biosynthesis